ncbi:hypothetical protein VitviT2T_007411 [Vitis vinifera]|nr:ankyrin repeat-containing protein At5g02620 [Vitis vinifera]WJZ88079.1 hypothetical protein VitviT2T_007411 [Vitis vinifera]|eukprot:XP_002262926.3 PREDICTED: ankyrin repeat-containing protein At5g02620 [Vitis vinifera]
MLRMTNNEHDTALHEAVRYHHLEVVKWLNEEDPEFTYGANFSGGTPLYMAAERGFTDLVKIIIENTNRNRLAHTGPMGRTALHAAVICRDPIMVKEILKWKPDLTKEVDENGWSPLHCAAYLGYVPIARQLLHKSDRSVVYLRVKNDDNKTALHIAATRGNRITAKLLVSYYPDCCEQVDINGNNALHLFMMQKRFFIRSLLNIRWMNVGALINEKNVEGQTPLHLLAHSQARSDCTFIRDKKVDKMALNSQNLTAVDVILLAEDLFGQKDLIIRRLKRAKARIGPLLWQKAMNKDEDKSQSKRNKGLDTSFLKKASDSHLLVAALVATVSFAAGFTLPGGYKDSDGMAKLSNKPGFKAFVVSDSLALVLSVTAVLCHFYNALEKKKVHVTYFLRWAYWFTKLGVGAMVVAFFTGLYSVLPRHSGIAIFVLIICICCSVLSITSGRPRVRKYF